MAVKLEVLPLTHPHQIEGMGGHSKKWKQLHLEWENIFTRIELYASDMLLLQYSVTEGQKKGELDYTNVNEVLLIVLMVESPQAFTDFDGECDKYIHRFLEMTADTGLSYPAKAKMIYVQLDKCLKQFREGRNAEGEDGKPDRLQAWLAAIADVNDEKVEEESGKDRELAAIRKEAHDMVQEKEVQNMVILDRYERMDWVTYGNEQKRKGAEDNLVENIKNLMETMSLTAQQAMDALKVPEESREKYLEKI